MCYSLTAQKITNNSLTSLNSNPIIFIKYHLHEERNISAKHFHQQHFSTMGHTKRQVTKDGTVIPSPESPQPTSPSQLHADASALCFTAARVAAAATSVLPSPGKTTDITTNGWKITVCVEGSGRMKEPTTLTAIDGMSSTSKTSSIHSFHSGRGSSNCN